MSYWLGVATPFVVLVVGYLIAAYIDQLKRKRRMKKHSACGLWHMYRLWSPWWLVQLTTVPIAEWRCSRGAQVPMDALAHGIDHSNPAEDER